MNDIMQLVAVFTDEKNKAEIDKVLDATVSLGKTYGKRLTDMYSAAVSQVYDSLIDEGFSDEASLKILLATLSRGK